MKIEAPNHSCKNHGNSLVCKNLYTPYTIFTNAEYSSLNLIGPLYPMIKDGDI